MEDRLSTYGVVLYYKVLRSTVEYQPKNCVTHVVFFIYLRATVCDKKGTSRVVPSRVESGANVTIG